MFPFGAREELRECQFEDIGQDDDQLQGGVHLAVLQLVHPRGRVARLSAQEFLRPFPLDPQLRDNRADGLGQRPGLPLEFFADFAGHGRIIGNCSRSMCDV